MPNKIIKIMLVFGTRPEAIKIAPLYQKLKSYPNDFKVLVCVTGQHRQMLDQVMTLFEIKSDVDLNLMRPAQDLSDITSSVLLSIRAVLNDHNPDLVVVHGDTTTSFATALACFYGGISVAHVESGLRTYDLHAPFPEEFNRQVVTKIANWHFAPTTLSRSNLLMEGVDEHRVFVTGNTVIDALLSVLDRIETDPLVYESILAILKPKLIFDFENTKFLLITGHRRENFGAGFLEICHAIKELAELYPHVHFVYPVHLNPNVQRPVISMLSGFHNIHLIEPLDYQPFVYLMKCSYMVLTDSGGIQEEAPSLGKPVLVMRDVTERPEAVDAGTVRLVGADKFQIVANVIDLLDNHDSYIAMSRAHNPYGDGHACDKIISVLKKDLNAN